jgi:predicted hydrocarbon binding protein
MKAVRKDVKEMAIYPGLADGKAIDIRLLRLLSNSILKTRIDGHEILYFSGKLVGEEFGKKIGRCNIKKLSTSIAELVDGLKLGRVESVREIENGLLVRVGGCPLCDPGKPAGDTRCHFFAGLLAGIASESMKRHAMGKETDCKEGDENACVFKLDFL